MIWAHKMGAEGKDINVVKQEAADAGTAAHDLIECWIRKIQPDLQKYPEEILSKAMQCFENFLTWQRRMEFKPLYAELELVSEEHQYGGCLDLVAEIDGKVCLFDWKSSQGTYPDYLMQASAYKNLWVENHPDVGMPGGIYLLRIDKNTAAWANHWWADVPEALEAFLLLRRLYSLKPVIERLT